MFKIEIDKDTKIVTLRLKDVESVDSEVKGNVVLDYDKSGELVKIDVMDVNIDELAEELVEGKVVNS